MENDKENVDNGPGTEEINDENSPPSPKVRKINRRSSVAMARRMSRASAVSGISLEDQLAMVPGADEASSLDRFRQVLNTVVRNTCRTIERAETDEGELEDEARKVSRILMDGCILSQEKLEGIVSSLDKTEMDVKPGDLLSSKVRAVREYTQRLENESTQWRKFLSERNKIYKQSEANLRQAEKGIIKVDENQFFSLSAEDKKFIRSLPDLTVAMTSLQRHEERQACAAKRMAREAVKLRGSLVQLEADLEETARTLGIQASTTKLGEEAAELTPREILEMENESDVSL